jgi:hypothetical protein
MRSAETNPDIRHPSALLSLHQVSLGRSDAPLPSLVCFPLSTLRDVQNRPTGRSAYPDPGTALNAVHGVR